MQHHDAPWCIILQDGDNGPNGSNFTNGVSTAKSLEHFAPFCTIVS